MERNEAVLHAYLWKDASKSRVFINERKTPGAAEIVTAYKVLGYSKARNISRLEVELVTGRTHQIRAHLAFIGHPVIGDGKYGTNAINREFGLKRQALWAYRLKFDFTGNAGILNYLKGREFQAEPDFTLNV
jgi:23S rRNA pseudouridine955/2504/2580 synthase